nr:hypothetical protein [Clostridiales bacterium]
ECDPQFSGDGAAILFHDTDLNRMADDPRKIADLSYSEICRAMEAAGKAVHVAVHFFLVLHPLFQSLDLCFKTLLFLFVSLCHFLITLTAEMAEYRILISSLPDGFCVVP